MKPRRLLSFITAAAALALVSAQALATRSVPPPRGTVYVMSNATDGNAVLAFNRRADGRLDPAGAFPTRGFGTGGALGNQGSLVLHPNQDFLFAANAGSGQITVFEVLEGGLNLRFVVQAIGLGIGVVRPISIAVHDRLLYVLNEGVGAGADNIVGFEIGPDGVIAPMGSTAPLSAAQTDPAQIEFSPDGRFLVVTEKATDIIDVFGLDGDGRIVSAQTAPSAGRTPFGFAFGKRNQVFVSEAAAGAPGGGSVSSYELSPSGQLDVIRGAVPTAGTATCWVVTSNDGRFAYVTNTGSASLSAFNIAFEGDLTLRNANGIAGRTGAGTTPIDLALSPDQRNLYALDNTRSRITVFRVATGGGLNRLQFVDGLPRGANGIAVR
ncbi:MAG: lactonase family protein [Gammaproteobacteria bacterium]